LGDRIVFVGGAVVDLLVTDPASGRPRATKDVDVAVLEVAAYADLCELLRSLDFAEDVSEDAPMCRWIFDGIKVDVVPCAPGPWGETNRWFPEAAATATVQELEPGRTARVIDAPCFLATKLEAFASRGAGDFLASHDIEDVITVVDGRPEIVEEVRAASAAVRDYLVAEVERLLALAAFRDAIPGHLPGDAASQARAEVVEERLRAMTRSG
jgi:predicted nucleotidyltransferase